MAFANASSKQMYYIFWRPRISLFIGVMCVPTLNLLSTWVLYLLFSFLFLIRSLSLVSLSYLPHTHTQAQCWQMPGSPRAHYDPVHHRVTSHKTCGISSGKCWKQSLCPGPAYNRSPRLWCWCCEEPQDMPCGHGMTQKWQTLHLYRFRVGPEVGQVY